MGTGRAQLSVAGYCRWQPVRHRSPIRPSVIDMPSGWLPFQGVIPTGHGWMVFPLSGRGWPPSALPLPTLSARSPIPTSRKGRISPSVRTMPGVYCPVGNPLGRKSRQLSKNDVIGRIIVIPREHKPWASMPLRSPSVDGRKRISPRMTRPPSPAQALRAGAVVRSHDPLAGGENKADQNPVFARRGN